MSYSIARSTTPRSKNASRLLALAPEIRDKIYKELFRGNRVRAFNKELLDLPTQPLRAKFPPFSTIILACHQTHAEALIVFYKVVELVFIPIRTTDLHDLLLPRYREFQSLVFRCIERPYVNLLSLPPLPIEISAFVESVISELTDLRHFEFDCRYTPGQDATGISFEQVITRGGEIYHDGAEKVLSTARALKVVSKMQDVMGNLKNKAGINDRYENDLEVSWRFGVLPTQRVPSMEWYQLYIYPRLTLMGDGKFNLSYKVGKESFFLQQALIRSA